MAARSRPSEQMGFHFGQSSAGRGEDEQVEARCPTCRTIVQVPSWYAEEGVQLHFCSAECRQSWTAEQPSFEIRLDGQGQRRGANWDIQARRARERDGYICQVCGVSEEELGRQLDVHHKIPFRSFRSNVEANKLEHLISVCPSCHAGLEARLRRDLPLFGKT